MSAINTVSAPGENGISNGRWHKTKLAWNWTKRAWYCVWKVAQFGTELGREISVAELAKRQADAKKVCMEAESIGAECNDKKQRTVRFVNEEIARIFLQVDQSEMSKRLQIANLLAENPQIAEHLKVLETLSLSGLSRTKEDMLTSRLEVK